MQRRYAHTFDIATCPHLYVTQYPVGNASRLARTRL